MENLLALVLVFWLLALLLLLEAADAGRVKYGSSLVLDGSLLKTNSGSRSTIGAVAFK
jgi:hypothetical protein